MAVALARSKSDATPSRTQAHKATPVVHRTSSDSRRYGLSGRSIQPALRISAAHDPAEREAESVAAQVTRGSIGHTAAGLQRSPLLVQRQSIGAAGGVASPVVEARVRAAATGGSPLVPALRQTLEPRFRADFGAVRLHTDARAAALATAIGARAFTFGHHIFFNTGQYQPQTPEGLELLAHELTHTIQQSAVIQRAVNDAPVIGERTAPQASRSVIPDDALNYIADAASAIPGYTLLTLIIGRNPINMRAVERNVTNVLRAFIGLIPGGEILFQVLQRYGVVERIGNWVNTQTAALGLNFQTVRDAFVRFTDTLGLRDIFSPGDVWQRARTIFTPIIGRITGFVGGLVTQAVTWLKETFMEPLSGFCRQIPGYGLVTVMLGRDPFTNAPVPRTALPAVRAFAEFIPSGTEKVDQLVQSGALERAYTWFQQETGARNLTWARVTGTFTAAWATLQLADVLQPIATLQRMVGLFRPLFVDLVSFAGAALMKLLELIYEAAMGAGGRRILDILMRARSTFIVIIQNPVGFLRNLLGAVGQGIRQFMTNILGHLRDGVIAWLTGPVARAGIQMPERWDARGIIWFVLQILGLTWANVRGKLVRLIGEPAMAMLERGFALITDIRERGLVVALRERVTEFFGTLRDSALGAIRSFIQERIVMAGITQLLSMLIPVAAIMQAIQKTYTTIQFFIQRINQILDFVESIVNSIAAIASGSIGAAANLVERTMARTIPVILDFLARFIGLGDVGAQVQTTIRNLQGAVDGMLNRAVDWIRNQARNLASRALGGDPTATPQQRLANGVREGTTAVNRLSGSRVGIALIRPLLAAIRIRHRMQSLDAQARNGRWAVVGVVNPTMTEMTTKEAVDVTTPGAVERRYQAATSGFGILAIVTGLNTIGSPQPPTAEGNPTWNRLRRRMLTAGSEYYVRGHLINGTFGGPGNDWRNLTPLTQRANNSSIASMLRTFENPVRTAVRSGDIATIRVEAVYRPLGRGAVVAGLRAGTTTVPGRTAAQRATIADVIEAEESVPAEIVATGSLLSGTTTTALPPSRTQNVVDTDLARYFVADSPGSAAINAPATRPKVNLSTVTAASTLAALAGMNATRAAQILAARPEGGFTSRDHFVTTMNAAGLPGAELLHNMVSTANVRIVYR